MALEPGATRLSMSPTNSGRESPTSKKFRIRRGEDELYGKDKTFRRYASGVERSLSLFDTALEDWADYISFLGRLLKSLQSHPSAITVIPSKGLVARRLAQCLNPTLPAGVHQKALEVYSYIFSMIGSEVLSKDLQLYLPGLSSTLSFASLSVRAPFLTLLETHLLDLDPLALRPALKALVLALLPGLEDETSEDFERTLKLLDDFKLAVRWLDKEKQSSGDEYFWQCFFLASITSNGRRLGALAYLARHLPKLGNMSLKESVDPNTNGHSTDFFEDPFDQAAETLTSPEPGLLVRCFATGLSDEQILIQRGFLDLLVSHLPLHARVLQKIVKQEDLELLLAAASGVVARRDMSLNRRLWTWLLGPEPSHIADGDGAAESPISVTADPMNSISSTRTNYFEAFGLQPLTRAILQMILKDHLTPSERAKPFRICLSLMDRWEIGGLVVPEIFLPVVNSVRSYYGQSNSKSDFKEVLRSASVFFDGVESGLIWSEIIGQIVEAVGPSKSSVDTKSDKLSLVKFILTNFNVREEEMLMIHAPLAALTILTMIDEAANLQNPPDSSPMTDGVGNISRTSIDIAFDLIELIPEQALLLRPSTSRIASSDVVLPLRETETGQILGKIRTFYVQDQGNLDAAPPPFNAQEICELLLREAGRVLSNSLDLSISSSDVTLKTKLFVSLLSKSPKAECLEVEQLILSTHDKLSALHQLPFSAFTSIVSFVTELYPRYISVEQFSGLIDPLVRFAWKFLSPSCPKYHVEAVRGLWQLQTSLSFSNHDIESSICKIITENETTSSFASRSADSGRSFGILWTHTLQDNSGILDRRGSKPLKMESRSTLQTSVIGNFEIMLGRPLFLLLDALLDERTQLFVTIRTWLQTLTAVDKLFHLFTAKFSGFGFLQTASSDGDEGGTKKRPLFTQDDDLDQCLYYLQKLSNILRWSPDSTWVVMAKNTISTDKTYRDRYLITGRDDEISLQEFFVHVCLRAVMAGCEPEDPILISRTSQLQRTALAVLHQILLNPCSSPLSELHLENYLIDRLRVSLEESDPFVQVALLDVIFASLKLNGTIENQPPPSPLFEPKTQPQDAVQGTNLTVKVDRSESFPPMHSPPPASLVNCLQAGFSAFNSRPVLDSWTSFLSEVLPLYSETIFQVLIPMVETLCSQVAQTFATLQKTFRTSEMALQDPSVPESTLLSLLNALEQVLARGHERLLRDEAKTPALKSPDQPQSFFGNIVSGVFSSEIPQTRSQTANNRLTVLLSFQDAARICFTIWSWGSRGPEGSSQDPESAASFGYTSLRMRNRARRLMEHLFAAEALECLETLVEIWQRASLSIDSAKYTSVFNLLHVLDGSKPKHTIPAIFDAIYSRTNPTALDPARKSTLTSSLLDTDLALFLVEYARSLEDDAMDEIWIDCMTFLKDILSNPFPHRQILPSLIEFAAILGEKVDNTNFGEQRKMRKELGDLFLRLLTAMVTTKPMVFSEGSTQPGDKQSESYDGATPRQINRTGDVVSILVSVAPNLPKILVDPDRISTATTTISTSVIGPTLRSKSYPENITKNILSLLYQLSRLPNTQKLWKKDIADAFNDTRFFATPLGCVESGWLPLLRQWSVSDKDRMAELLSRLNPPTTAGIVFGVGATSARLEADRKTQLNLRRIATLVLASPSDTFVADLVSLEEKLIELLSATPTSSPSSTTRADIYILLRALVLKTSSIHLALLWPTINSELYTAISSVVSADHSQSAETYNNSSVLQACKLLDTLLCVTPDEFQLQEWLFVTDTIDAVYRPQNYQPIGLIDELAEELGVTSISKPISQNDKSLRRPLLGPGGIDCDDVSLERRDELVGKVLRPFFGQLSRFCYERTYDMGQTDWETCRSGALADLFDERGIVKAM